MPAPKWTDEQKTDAVVRYIESGAAAASRATGIPAATIRSWANRTPGVQQRHVEKTEQQIAEINARTGLRWAETRAEVIGGLSAVTSALLELIQDKIEADDIRAVKEGMVALAIGIDKAQLLTGGATGRNEQQIDATVRNELLSEGRARVMELMPPSRTKTGTDG